MAVSLLITLMMEAVIIINGLLDHDGQFITINYAASVANLIPLRQRTRKINSETVMHFQHLLKNEAWEPIYRSSDTSNKFNSFLCSFLNIYEASFPTKYKSTEKIKKWVDNTKNNNIFQTQEVSIYPQQEQ
jgi:hypothetical protein